MTDVVEILENLIKYDTRTNEASPGLEVKLLLENELEEKFIENGFEVEYFESEGHFSILAVKQGSTPIILYSGHVDVVPWDDRWNTNPQELIKTTENDEEVLIGRGVCDMKGGVAALITALPILAQCDATIIFAITGDEEIGGLDGTKIIVDHLVAEGMLPDYVITADAAGMEIITRRRNVFDLYFKAKKTIKKIRGFKVKKVFQTNIISAKTNHAAYFIKEKDKHCVKLAADYIIEQNAIPTNITGKFVKVNVIPDSVEVEFVVPSDEGEEFDVDEGLLHLFQLITSIMKIDFETEAHSDYGINSTVNVIEELEDSWRIQVDIRAMLSEFAEELDGAILLLLDEIAHDFDVEIKKSVGFIATPDDSPLVTATTKILSELDYSNSKKSAERGGATDGRFFAQHGIHTIDIGPIGWGVHGPNETVLVKSLQDLVIFFEKSSHDITKDFRKKK